MSSSDAPKPASALPQRPVKVPPSKIPPPSIDRINKGFGFWSRKPTTPAKPD